MIKHFHGIVKSGQISRSAATFVWMLANKNHCKKTRKIHVIAQAALVPSLPFSNPKKVELVASSEAMALIGCGITMKVVLTNHVWAYRYPVWCQNGGPCRLLFSREGKGPDLNSKFLLIGGWYRDASEWNLCHAWADVIFPVCFAKLELWLNATKVRPWVSIIWLGNHRPNFENKMLVYVI